MTKGSQMEDNFTTFAKSYDELFDNDMYQAWAQYVQALTKPSPLLDLGGGAGRLAVLLEQAGYQVDLLDLSPNMLQLAQAHADQAGVSPRLLEGDMRDFSDWSTQYPIITSFADSLNYLPNLDDLEDAFQQVFDHLMPNGIFLFDVITPYQVNVGYDNYCYNNDDNPENIFMWTSFPGENENSVDHDLKFFTYNEELDAFNLLREVHHEQSYEQAVYCELLQKVGFNQIEISADFGQTVPNSQTTRWFFKASKGDTK